MDLGLVLYQHIRIRVVVKLTILFKSLLGSGLAKVCPPEECSAELARWGGSSAAPHRQNFPTVPH
jgi:hypothetical protein